MGNASSGSLRGMICVPEERNDSAVVRPWKTVERRAQPIMPVFTLPKLPKLEPGRPLDPEQRQELVVLQQQVQAQLMQQRVLVESLRQLPQFRNMSPTATGSGSLETEGGDADSAKLSHVIGPDPIGDTPAEDPENGEDKSPKAVLPRQNSIPPRADSQSDEKTSNSMLGTTTKVYVDFSTEQTNTSERSKDNLALLLEWDELMKRGGISHEDTGEPCIASPKQSGDQEKQSESSAARSTPSAPSQMSGGGAHKRTNAEPPVAPRRPMPSPAPNRPQEGILKEQASVAAASPSPAAPMGVADLSTLGTTPPGKEERRWIEAAVRRMFRSLGPAALDSITEAFREWKLPASVSIVKQQSPVSTGPGLCVLFEGVVDVLHRPTGGSENEKVFTYDRCGQCFGELELFYDVPRANGAGRKLHWATVATRTPVTLWTIQRDVLRGSVPGATTTNLEATGKPKSAPSQAPAPLCLVANTA
mmetsp:Transcript_59810/g.112908  ORF Transcript_59810/g.112908 Transcript_59810/m.112908 type:complete len:475 (-) Transcript_59810:96-1520(-)